MRGGGRGRGGGGGLWSSSAGSGTAHLRENCSSSHLRSWKLLNFSWPADPSFRRPRDGPPLVRPTHCMSPHHLLYSLASQPCRLRFSCVVCSKSCRRLPTLTSAVGTFFWSWAGLLFLQLRARVLKMGMHNWRRETNWCCPWYYLTCYWGMV
jgi:hypothetical protein